jgi:uncharacterized ion transporter superfamily protein YfcC
MEMMSRLRLGLIITLIIVWLLWGIITLGKWQGWYEISIGLWFASLILLVAGLIVKEREKKPQTAKTLRK